MSRKCQYIGSRQPLPFVLAPDNAREFDAAGQAPLRDEGFRGAPVFFPPPPAGKHKSQIRSDR